MATSFAEATQTLLSGNRLAWDKFGEHKGGSVTLGGPQQRRLFAYLLAQDAAKVAQGNEDLFAGLIASWNQGDVGSEPEGVKKNQNGGGDAWRLDRIEASGFGGLTLFGGKAFDLRINGENWCLEGQNGSGKTSLASAILWTLTGKRIRDQDGPIDEQGARSPVLNNAGKKIGEWPSLASYPASPADLIKQVDVWVRLTFVNTKGEFATAYRRMLCPLVGNPTREVNIDSQLVVAPELIEIGLLMPARLARVGFGDRSQSLYEAVKMLTGLDQLADIAEGCASQFTHAGRRFLRYGKDNGIDGFKTKFDDSMAKAEKQANNLNYTLPETRRIDDKKVVRHLKAAAHNASGDAGTFLATLRSEIAPEIDTTTTDGRLKVQTAVSKARAILDQKTGGVVAFEAWAALREAAKDGSFTSLPAAIDAARARLGRALAWHDRQLADSKFRLKALAALSFVPPHEHTDASNCPLCASKLSTDEQRALASELAELQRDAEEAERKIADVCRDLDAELLQHLTIGLKRHRDILSGMNPKEDYASAILGRFCDEPPFSDILTGLAGRVKAIVHQQKLTLPTFSFPEFDYGGGEPTAAIGLRRSIHGLERLIAFVTWWSEHRALFVDAWTATIGRKQIDDKYPPETVEAQLRILEQSLAKALPLDDLSGFLIAASIAAESWGTIRAVQDIRESIAKALEPLKDLRFLVGAETARSIASLSGRMKTILARIHLQERLAYEETSLGKKAVNVAGWFEPGMQIDAALVANTSWLRAILWTFIFALREQTIELLGANPVSVKIVVARHS